MAAGLPFPRKNLGAFTAMAIVVAAAVFFLPLLFCATPHGWMMVMNGGAGMYVLLLLAFFAAGVLGLLGALTVRGKPAPAAVVAMLAALPVISGAILTWLAMRRVLGAVSGESVDPTTAARILAEGTSEVDSLLILGCGIGACAFGAGAVALLGAAGTVDRARSGVPAGKGFVAPLVIGVIGMMVAFGLRVSLRAMFPSMLLTIPSLAIVTVLAAIAAGNGPLVRGWHDRREAGAWAVGLLAAAVLAAVGVALVDHAAAFASESSGLGAIAGESVDDSQKARILAEALHDTRAARLCGWVDGLFAFVIVGSALLPALGRGPDGKVRSPFGPAFFAALGGVAALVGAVTFTRTATFGDVAKALGKMDARSGASIVTADPDVPRVGERGTFVEGDLSGPSIIVHADGTSEQRTQDPGGVGFSENLVVLADRRAKYAAVARAIHAALDAERATGTHAAPTRRRTVSFLVLALPTRRPVDLGPYGMFLKPGAPTVGVGIDSPRSLEDDSVAPRPTDDMNAVVAAIIAAQKDSTGEVGFPPKHVVLRPPQRDEW